MTNKKRNTQQNNASSIDNSNSITFLTNQMSVITEKLEAVIEKTNQIDDLSKTLAGVVSKTNQIDSLIAKVDNMEEKLDNLSKKVDNVDCKADRNHKMLIKFMNDTNPKLTRLQDDISYLKQDRDTIITVLRSKKIIPIPL